MSAMYEKSNNAIETLPFWTPNIHMPSSFGVVFQVSPH
jgi:hypothetical protein